MRSSTIRMMSCLPGLSRTSCDCLVSPGLHVTLPGTSRTSTDCPVAPGLLCMPLAWLHARTSLVPATKRWVGGLLHLNGCTVSQGGRVGSKTSLLYHPSLASLLALAPALLVVATSNSRCRLAAQPALICHKTRPISGTCLIIF